MKEGKSLQVLSAQLSQIRATARDFVVPATQLTATSRDAAGLGSDGIALNFRSADGEMFVDLNNWSHGQLAGYSDIPKAYYDRILRESPELLSENINHGLRNQNGDRRMLRLVDGNLRALVSPKYRRLDGADLLDAVLPAMLESGMNVVSSDLTERRLYLRATTERLKVDVKVGDTVQAGIMISNSDVGAGALRVEPFIMRLSCLNGMVMQHALKRAHLGKSLAMGDDVQELLSEGTIRLGEAAFWAEVKDVVKACLSPEIFNREVEKMVAATTEQITNFNLNEVVEIAVRKIGLHHTTEQTKKSIVDALATGNQGAGLTKWGLANSFTAAAAADHLDFDTSIDLERAGAQILELSKSDWSVVAEKKRA